MLVTLDNYAFNSKPNNFSAITNRLKRTGGVEIDNHGFCAHVGRGKSWMGAIYEPCDGSSWGHFIGQQVFGLDFDNSTEDLDASDKSVSNLAGRRVKRPLREGEPGYLDPLMALRRCYDNGLNPLCMYPTFSATLEPLHYRFRIVFVMEELVTERAEVEKIISALLALFPEADQKCRNVNRIFLGSPYWVSETWEVTGNGQS